MNPGDRIRIVNEGGPARETKVFAADGRDLTADLNITGARINFRELDGLVTADLELLAPRVDVEATVSGVHRFCPWCGHDDVEETEEETRA